MGVDGDGRNLIESGSTKDVKWIFSRLCHLVGNRVRQNYLLFTWKIMKDSKEN